MEKTDDGYRLSTGREFYANEGLISISRSSDGSFRVCEGYDGVLGIDPAYLADDELRWTAEERRELAEYMMALWTAFKAAQG